MRWLAAVFLMACSEVAVDAFAEARLIAALPTEAALDVSFPNGGGAEKPGNRLTGSGFVNTSVIVAHSLNVSIRSLLAPLRKALTAASTETPYGRVWRHEDSDGKTLLVAEEGVDGHVEYTVSTQRKGGAWAPLISGTATRGLDGTQGAIWIDLRQDASPKTTGRFLVLYSDAPGQRYLTLYSYGTTAVDDDTAEADAGSRVFHFEGSRDEGSLVFARDALAVHYGPGQPLVVSGNLVTRWNLEGGRTDIVAWGGDLAAAGFEAGRGSECWDRPGLKTTYGVAYRTPIGEPEAYYGDTGTESLCRFSDFLEPALPQPPDAPPDPILPAEATD